MSVSVSSLMFIAHSLVCGVLFIFVVRNYCCFLRLCLEVVLHDIDLLLNIIAVKIDVRSTWRL